MSIKELITNPAGKLSTNDCMVLGCFITTTGVVVWYAFKLVLPDWMFWAYVLTWGGHSVASKFVAYKNNIGGGNGQPAA
ncbi:hypothetical protein [Martelella alba]|uniref:DUF2644 domain-containing protein n=1 Tax=Martelella alba TaxID=2590451 RepID=A0ABY2SSP6_9HYPH|nr:hypothetical protein [Martelella alba]TKI08648.1 hypothetical protein FCN80_00925 [Martelella alba]